MDSCGRNVFAEQSRFAHRAKNAKNIANAENQRIRKYQQNAQNRTGAGSGRDLVQPRMVTHEQNRRDKIAD